MDEDTTKQEDSGELRKRPIPFAFRLASVKSARQSMSRLIREYGKGNIDRDAMRDCVYAISHLSNLLKMEHDSDLDKRIEELEAAIARLQGLKVV